MKINNVIFCTLALFMGAAHLQSFAMEQEQPKPLTPQAQEAFRITIREMIRTLPRFPMQVTLAEYSRALEAISALIQISHIDPGTTTAGLIREKGIGDLLFNIAERHHNNTTMHWLGRNRLVSDPQRLFFDAFAKKDLAQAEFWLQNGANIHKQDQIGQFSLLAEVAYNKNYSLEQLKFLLDHGANVNEADWRFNISPLEHALSANAWDKAKLLLKYGAKPATPRKLLPLTTLSNASVK